MRIGVGVEGPSDRIFWDKVLHKHFRSTRFDIRNMKDRGKLIRDTPRLLDSFHDAHYNAAFILLDRNSEPCPTAVLELFDSQIQQEARKPLEDRFLSICIAVRELEAWFLADSTAINAIFPKANYSTPERDTGSLNAEKVFNGIWRQQHTASALNKIYCAKLMAPKFNPLEASKHSSSFNHFWSRVTSSVGK